MTARIAIVGASGYTGAELAHILARHPGAGLVGVFGSASRQGSSERLGDLFPALRGVADLPVLPADEDAIVRLAPDAVLLATPHEASLQLAGALHAAGLRVLDLSAALRLPDPALYPKYYHFEHHRPDLLRRAVYGLPERARDRLRGASLVAVPGCYPTSAILPLAPLVEASLLRPGVRPIIDAISGVSGAGRSPSLRTLFCEVSVQPYGVWNHRHTPEIETYAGTPVVFTPHLGPYDRGIVSTIHAELAPGVSEDHIRAALARAYSHEPFIRLLPPGTWPSVAGVARTNFCDIALQTDAPGGHLIIVSALDNLLKGAAGQAVQCLNLALGLPETAGLTPRAEAAP